MRLEPLELIVDEKPRVAAWNMAVDEALLSTATGATLRCYRWQERTVSFGYFNHWKDMAKLYPDCPLIRRWTGGGAVEHGEDFTYSLVIPVTIGPTKPAELYQFVHSSIARILRQEGLPVVLTELPDTGEAAGCFEKAVTYDLKIDGKKVAGAAIRRNQRGFLLQGSIQRVTIPVRFETILATAIGDQVLARPLAPAAEKLAFRLVEEKYGSDAWNRRS